MQGYDRKLLCVLEQDDYFGIIYRRFVGEIIAKQEDELNRAIPEKSSDGDLVMRSPERCSHQPPLPPHTQPGGWDASSPAFAPTSLAALQAPSVPGPEVAFTLLGLNLFPTQEPE